MTSLRPKDMVEGGGPPMGLNLTVKQARIVIWDYDDPKRNISTLAAQIQTVDDQGNQYKQYYSAGDPNRFTPSEDGRRAVPRGSATSLNNNTNLAVLMQSIINAGFPEDKLGGATGDDISSIEGLYAYWDGTPAPERKGLSGARVGQLLSVPVKIHRLPWDNQQGAQQGQAVQGGVGSPEMEDAAVGVLEAALNGKQEITRQDMSRFVFRHLRGNPQRNEISAYIFSPAFAEVAKMAGFALDGETVKRA